MATVREGNRPALLVVDLQVGVVASAWEADRVLANAATSVAKARAAGVPVIWVQHSDDDLPHGSPEWEWAPELAPGDDETRIHKHFNSSWEDTELESVLAGLGVSHVVLAGAATNWCIRATAYAALERGYDLTLVKDAHTTESLLFRDGREIPAEHIVDDLNATVQWLAYPGRASTTVDTAELAFP